MTPAERSKAPKLDDYFIDTGLPKEEVEKFVSVGDSVTRVQETIEIGDCVNGKSIDNRLSVFALIEVVKRIEKTPHDFYAVFSVQEEVGVRGAEVAAKYINPDFSIVLDTTIANDLPGQPGKNHISKLGSGAAIKLMDGSFICDIRMVDFLKTTADRNDISWQTDLINMRGGTNGGMLQRAGVTGSIAGGISFPTRYLHQTTETAHKTDIQAVIDLCVAAIETLDKHHWEI
jgi:endoglucanase